jgi:hypothetical protein
MSKLGKTRRKQWVTRVAGIAGLLTFVFLATEGAQAQFVAGFNYQRAAEQIRDRFLTNGGQVSERDLLLLMSQPLEFTRLINGTPETPAWSLRTPELVQKTKNIRIQIFKRVCERIKDLPEAVRPRAVIALGSWADLLNPNTGDMDLVLRGDDEAARAVNRMIGEEINSIFSTKADDICAQVLAPGARFTVEPFEIFVSTVEDFGYSRLANTYLEALKIAAEKDQVEGAKHIAQAADEILCQNLRTQSYAATHPEMYPGQAGQDFLRNYFNTAGKSKTWLIGADGRLSAGMEASQLSEAILRELGMVVESIPDVSDFPVLAHELKEWSGRTERGAREQAKGLVRACKGGTGKKMFSILTEEQQRAYAAANVLTTMSRENMEDVEVVLRSFGFTSQERFGEAGAEAIFNLTRDGYVGASQQVLKSWRMANNLAAEEKLVESELTKLLTKMKDNEILAGLRQLSEKDLVCAPTPAPQLDGAGRLLSCTLAKDFHAGNTYVPHD